MATTPTRLLVLGGVRIMQPVSGYDVRRELVSWRLEEWTSIMAGSIYSALKTLERDGLIEVVDEGGRRRPRPAAEKGGRPARTLYVVTGEGEKEFQTLLRSSWWRVQNPTEPLIPALCLLPFMPRGELIEALRSRLGQLEGQLAELRFTRSTIRDGATGADGEVPDHVREVLDFTSARIKAEIEWSRGFQRRLRDGEYVMADEWSESEQRPPGRVTG